MSIKKIAALTAATSGLVLAGAGAAMADTAAHGQAYDSPGLGSGNNVQIPVHIPVNLCGDTVSIIGLLNPAYDNSCVN
jgi:hypothetical protein